MGGSSQVTKFWAKKNEILMVLIKFQQMACGPLAGCCSIGKESRDRESRLEIGRVLRRSTKMREPDR